MNNTIEHQIAEILHKNYGISIDKYFLLPMDMRGRLFTTVFLDFLGKRDFEDENIKVSIDRLNTYISEDKEREEKMNGFLLAINKLRHAHIQKYPDIAIVNVNKDALAYYIDITFGMEDPEALFYDIKSNHHLIEHLFEVFTGHRFNKQFNGLITYVSGYPDAKICYPNKPIDGLESLDELIPNLLLRP